MARLLLALFLLVPACFAQQLQFYAFDGTTDTLIPSNSYVVAQTGIGAKSVTRIHVRNVGTASVSIPRISLSGQGFAITSTPFLPYTLAAGAQVEVQVTFAPTVTGTYSANLGVNSASLVLIGSSSAVATLTTVANGVSQAVSQLDFGSVATNSKASIVAHLENRGTTSVTVKSIQLNGSGFTATNLPPLPATLLPTQTAEIDLQFFPTAAQTYSGTLTIDGVSYPLKGATFAPVFPALTVTVPSTASSQAQLPLTVDLAGPAPYGASGYVQVDFKPANGLQDDASILFLDSGRRTMNFTINSGDTQATFVGSKTTSFQTGTTAGTLTFTAVFQTSKVTSTTSIAAAPLAICANLSKPNSFQVSLTITGYDNTRSASKLGFTFYACSTLIHDSYGNLVCDPGSSQSPVAPGLISYDASRDFSQYFASSTAGGAFTMLAQFPISGSNTVSIDSVNLSFTNSVGTGTISNITLSGLNACTGYTKTP